MLRLDHVVLPIWDVEKSIAFYRDLLGLKLIDCYDGDDWGGVAVHIGARIMAEAAPCDVLASGTIKDLIAGSGLTFIDRGARTLKGVPGEWRLFLAQA